MSKDSARFLMDDTDNEDVNQDLLLLLLAQSAALVGCNGFYF